MVIRKPIKEGRGHGDEIVVIESPLFIHSLVKRREGEGREKYIRPQNLHPRLPEPGDHVHSRIYNSSSRISPRAEPWMEEEICLTISIPLSKTARPQVSEEGYIYSACQ